jgi:hypothetical protein
MPIYRDIRAMQRRFPQEVGEASPALCLARALFG